MTKLRWYATGETTADWEERLYHIIIPVRGGIAETDDELAIETLLRSGYERVPEETENVLADDVVEAVSAPKKTAAKKAAVKG